MQTRTNIASGNGSVQKRPSIWNEPKLKMATSTPTQAVFANVFHPTKNELRGLCVDRDIHILNIFTYFWLVPKRRRTRNFKQDIKSYAKKEHILSIRVLKN